MITHHSEAAPPAGVPSDYVGPVVLPGSGRLVYWTGRVAIGLRHKPQLSTQPSASAEALQRALLERAPS
jgi:hypothetical protein